MFASEPCHPPTRITDLLNPVRPSDVPPNVLQHSPPAPHEHSRAHTYALPSFDTLEGRPYARGSQQRRDVERGQTQILPSEEQAFAQEGGSARAGLGDAEERSQAHFNLRAACWESALARGGLALPPLQGLQGMRDYESRSMGPLPLSLHERANLGGAGPASASENCSGTTYLRHSRPAVTLPTLISMPVNTHALSPVAAFAASHFAAPPAVIAIPHSPYGQQQQQQQQATLGPHHYAHHPDLARPLLVPPSPVLLSPRDPKDDGNATMALDSPSSIQAAGCASVRIRETNETSPARAQTPFVLQLHPTQLPQQNHKQKKRSHSEASMINEEGTSLMSASGPRSTASSVSSLSSLNSVAPMPIRSGETVEDNAPNSKKARKSKASSPSSVKSSTTTKKGKVSKRRSVSEESANAKSVSSQKGKEKDKGDINYHYAYHNGQPQPLDPHMTMQLGYGVSVMPIREGVHVLHAIGYPYAMQMHPLGVGMPVAVTAAQSQQQAKLFPELQFARCMSARYRPDAFPRCVSCTRRWAGDTCRFQNIRILLRDANKNLAAVGFQPLTAKGEGAQMNYPDKWNIELEKSHVDRTMETVARALLPHLQKEQAHQRLGSVVKRQRETDVRATCDTCMTSLFSSSWMCRQCGREACEECYQTIYRLTADPTPTTPVANGKEGVASSGTVQHTIRERHAQANPFFLSCNRKAEHGVHTFNPVTRFVQSELDDAVSEMLRLVHKEGVVVDDSVSKGTKGENESGGAPEKGRSKGDENREAIGVENAMTVDAPGISSASKGSSDKQAVGPSQGHANESATSSINSIPSSGLTPDSYNDGICTLVSNPIPPFLSTPSPSISQLPPMSTADIINPPSWPVPYYTGDNLTEPVFASQWERGTPLVVTGLLDRFQLRWTPDYFIKTFGTQPCIILECQTEANKRVNVAEFFSSFGRYEGRTECWKLKDWPPSTDFKTAFPELYDDFSSAVPIPNYSRRDGALNIASHFPTNTVAPDLGPKMYNAFASNENPGSKGTTRLHMDMADAVNIMLHSELTPDGAPGCAAWDIFRAEDSLNLRQFFKRYFKGQYQNDPIHAQTFYLDTKQRVRLFAEFGVRSFRIYQRPGEAVFIPAGCAHQVCNLADSIKVACDFVSPENIARCETLTREFRAQNQSLVWKEDVLQLRSMMWFAWLSCRRQQAKWMGDAEGAGKPAASKQDNEADRVDGKSADFVDSGLGTNAP